MDMDAMSQREALLLMYALARKALENPSRMEVAVRRIVSVFEANFIEKGRAKDGTEG